MNQVKDILIKGAREHNLKNIDVRIPRNSLVVITGLSGSGKSSLAFDTLYAEGQRRYVESLSSYARQFLGKIDKPAVEHISGISPAIAIEQKVSTRSSRSTVGTMTEIYDYLKLLYARVGKTISPVSGKEVKRDTPDDVYRFIHALPENTRVVLTAPLQFSKKESWPDRFKTLLQQGYSRIFIDGALCDLEELVQKGKALKPSEVEIVIDRFIVSPEDEDNRNRISESIENAYFEGRDACFLHFEEAGMAHKKGFNNRFERDGIGFEIPNEHFFSFNSPVGACKRCEGLGNVIGIDEDLVIPDKSLSVYDGAVACWKGEKMSEWNHELVMNAHKFDFPVHTPISKLTHEQYQLLWSGNKHFKGLDKFFKFVEENTYKIQYRVMLSRYRGKTRCPECRGTRLRLDASYVKVGEKSIQDLVLTPIAQLPSFFKKIQLSDHDQRVAHRLLTEIRTRIQYLIEVGVGYLSLNRLSSTLSGGETQRINLATSLGSSLVGSLYILDEPSIGLHPRDTMRLIQVLSGLRKQGNTVIVVEHEEEMMRAADFLIDLGPEAGSKGGELVFSGNYAQLENTPNSLTSDYLFGRRQIEVPDQRRKWKRSIRLLGAAENNLKNIDVEVPLGVMTVVTGVSGSGKSTMVNKVLYPALKRKLGGYSDQAGKFREMICDADFLADVEFVDQNPIGKSSRSNPVTYVKAFDDIRELYADQKLAKVRGYRPSYFSFNVEGGRCETCKGDGKITVEMQFMPDVQLTCEACGGHRFQDEILDVMWQEKNIADVLDMTIDDALNFFSSSDHRLSRRIAEKLTPLAEVGMGYVQLGQSSSTLSGGEAQRIKLASFLLKGAPDHGGGRMLFIFDEPTTGLHFHDIKKLMVSLNALIDLGHSVLIIEHNPEVIKCADWVIDLGPEGGDEGGNLVFAGTPEDLIKCQGSYTGQFLKEKLLR
jgi:excinuclease ABC subunit A